MGQMMQLLQQMKNAKNKSNDDDNMLNGFMNGNRDELIDEDPMQQFVSGMQQNMQMMQMLETMKSAVNANKFRQQQAGNTMFDPIVEEEKLNLSDESDDDDEAPQVDLFGGNDLERLLAKGGFGQYSQNFMQAGVDTKESLFQMDESFIPFIIEHKADQERFAKFISRQRNLN